jgi:hypothetical protein
MAEIYEFKRLKVGERTVLYYKSPYLRERDNNYFWKVSLITLNKLGFFKFNIAHPVKKFFICY